MRNKNNNDMPFKYSVSIEDDPIRLVDVAEEFNKNGQISYGEVIDRCLKKGYGGLLPIYINPQECLYTESFTQTEYKRMKNCYVIECSEPHMSADFCENNEFVCTKGISQNMKITIGALLDNREKMEPLKKEQLGDDYLWRYECGIDDVRTNSDNGYIADIVLKGCDMGLFGDEFIDIYCSNKTNSNNRLTHLDDYFVLSNKEDSEGIIIGLYNLYNFPKDTTFYVNKNIFLSPQLERISENAISMIWSDKTRNSVKVNGACLLFSKEDKDRYVGSWFLLKKKHSPRFTSVRINIEDIFILRKDKHQILLETINNTADKDDSLLHIADEEHEKIISSYNKDEEKTGCAALNKNKHHQELGRKGGRAPKHDVNLQAFITSLVKSGKKQIEFVTELKENYHLNTMPRSDDELYQTSVGEMCDDIYLLDNRIHYTSYKKQRSIALGTLKNYFNTANKKLREE